MSAVEACDRGALGVGELTCIDEPDAGTDTPGDDELATSRTRRPGRYVGEALGFHLHAGVSVPANNRLGREILLRYCARPPLSLERLSVLDDGRIAYRIKKPWRKDRTHRVMTPLDFMARLVALVPPPRTPLIHFHGAFAPCFRRRALVVPASAAPRAAADCDNEGSTGTRERRADVVQSRHGAPTRPVVTTRDPAPLLQQPSNATKPSPPPPERVFKSSPWRIDWATLLYRVHDVDALACPCGGRLRFIELVTDRATAHVILTRLGLPTGTPKPHPATASNIDTSPPPDW